MKRLKKSITILVISLAIPNFATAQCDNIIEKCEAVIASQTDLIGTLKIKMEQCQSQLTHCQESQKELVSNTSSTPTWLWVVVGILAGVVAGKSL